MPARTIDETRTEFSPARVVSSEELFSGQVEVVILHRGVAYRLRVTRQDKLILTK